MDYLNELLLKLEFIEERLFPKSQKRSDQLQDLFQQKFGVTILPLLTALVYAPLYLLRTGDWRGTIALALIFPAMLWAHRSNFARWREGKEQTFRQFLFGRHEPQREEAGE